MSSFLCEHCGTAIIDSPRGYVTSCEHYKAEDINKLRSKHLEGDCRCCNKCECVVIQKLKGRLKGRKMQHDSEDVLMPPNSIDDLAESQVDIAPDFKIVLNELASNSLDVNNRGNING